MYYAKTRQHEDKEQDLHHLRGRHGHAHIAAEYICLSSLVRNTSRAFHTSARDALRWQPKAMPSKMLRTDTAYRNCANATCSACPTRKITS